MCVEVEVSGVYEWTVYEEGSVYESPVLAAACDDHHDAGGQCR